MNKKNLIFLFNVCFFSILSTLVIHKNVSEIYNFNNNILQYAITYFLILFPLLLIEFTLMENLSGQNSETTQNYINRKFDIFKSIKLSTAMFIACYYIATLALVLFVLIKFILLTLGFNISNVRAFGDKIDLNIGANFTNNGYGFNIFLIGLLILTWYIIWVATRKIRTKLVNVIISATIVGIIIMIIVACILAIRDISYLSENVFASTKISSRPSTTFLLAIRGAIFSSFLITLISGYYKIYEVKKRDILPLSLCGGIFATIIYIVLNIFMSKIFMQFSQTEAIRNGSNDLILVYIPKIIKTNMRSTSYVFFIFVTICFYVYQILIYLSQSILLIKTILTEYLAKYNKTRYESAGKFVRAGFVITLVYSSMMGIFFIKNISMHYIFYYLLPLNLLIELIMLFSVKLSPEIFINSKILTYIFKILTFTVLPLSCIYFIISTNLNGLAYGARIYTNSLPLTLAIGVGTIIFVIITPFLIIRRQWYKRRKV